MRFGWFGACWVPDLLEPNSVRLKVQPDSPTLNYYIFYFNFETFFFSSVALLYLQSHMWARRVEVSDDAGEGGASRSRMDPGSVRVTAWLGFAPIHKVKLISAATLRAFYEIWLVWCVLGAGFIRTKFCPPRGPA
jgi:hypothetical protein